jgi:hypothetical protein
LIRDQEEEDRRKKYVKDNKVNMRNYLTHQMVEKKFMTEIEKKIADEQVKLWSDENSLHFKKEKEINEKVRKLFYFLISLDKTNQ